jgi:hypothetical protein
VTEASLLEVAAWRLAVGSLSSEELPEIATEALLHDLDSPSLRLLAGQRRDDVRDSADLFRAALDELGIEVLDADTAQWRLVRRTAAQMVAGRIRPAVGATALGRAYHTVRESGDLRIFVGLASVLDDHPEDAEQIEQDMVAAARELLARPAPRRWITLMGVRERSPLTQTMGSHDIEVEPDALPLSDDLRRKLAGWDARFAATLSGWPVSGGFDSHHDAERFVAAGRQLVSRLQLELGPGYEVEYRPEPIRPPGVRLRKAAST